MKFISIATFLFLGVSFVTCGFTPIKDNYQLFDELHDGFDAILKFEEHSFFTSAEEKLHDHAKFSAVFRKPLVLTKGDNKDERPALVVQFEDFYMKVDNETFDSDEQSVLTLPFFLNTPEIHATEQDTSKTVMAKFFALQLFTFPLDVGHKMLRNVKFGETKASFEMNKLFKVFGDCKMRYSLKEDKKRVIVKIHTTRDQCVPPKETGGATIPLKLFKEFKDEFEKYGATDIDGASEFIFKFAYAKDTGYFSNIFYEVNGKLNTKKEVTFTKKINYHFSGYRPVIDESKLTKYFNLKDL